MAENADQIAELDTVKADKTEVNALATNKADKVDLVSTNAVVSLKANITDVNAQIAAVVSGAPKGVYATLTALQTTFPSGNSNIYIVVEGGGYWHYWNGQAGLQAECTKVRSPQMVQYPQTRMLLISGFDCLQSRPTEI